MEVSYFRFVLALVFVLALIGLCAWLVKRVGLGGRFMGARASGRRLRVVEITAIDGKRRLVLVRRDDTEHLLMVGGDSDVVIECGMPAREPVSVPVAEITDPQS